MSRPTHVVGRSASHLVPILDRSRNQLRLPVEILSEAMRQANGEGLASPVATVRLETGGIIVDGKFDPSAAALLRVIRAASMMVTVDVRYDGDMSVTTIWATPNRAVTTSTLDPELVDIHPIRLSRLPEVLSDIILARPPETVADRTITVTTTALADAEHAKEEPDRAKDVLNQAGLSDSDVELVLAFQAATARGWRISSTWATETGKRTTELHGLDAGVHGQWLMEMTGNKNEPGQMTFTPQGDGDVLRALREVLPRQWVGTPLNPTPQA